jgi:hypothetical protein
MNSKYNFEYEEVTKVYSISVKEIERLNKDIKANKVKILYYETCEFTGDTIVFVRKVGE